MMKKMTQILTVLLVVVLGAGCGPREEKKIQVEAQASTPARTVDAVPTQQDADPVLTQPEADAVLALAASKLEVVKGPEDVNPGAISQLENAVITHDYVSNFGKSNATMLEDGGLPVEPMSIAVLKVLQSEAAGKSSVAGVTMTIPNTEDTVLKKTDVVFKYVAGKWLIDNVIFTNK